MVGDIDHQWKADLADIQSVYTHSSPYRCLLCLIDVFSKYKCCRLLINLERHLFKLSILKGRKPFSLQTDKGLEFLNKEFQSFLDNHDIHFFFTSETKASVVEHFQRTLKSKMWKYFTHHKTRCFLDVLQQLLKAYNYHFHRSIFCATYQVSTNERTNMRPHRYCMANNLALARRNVSDETTYQKQPKFPIQSIETQANQRYKYNDKDEHKDYSTVKFLSSFMMLLFYFIVSHLNMFTSK